ncbi:hypothetical protein ACIPLC_01750 [Kitasatospora sp. NPDC086801]|uniref:hypothetical protein n=1 Tax=Kitasatospora sp. NPDC086801 TaxID=3364066 RepID=UPI00382D7F7C
MTQKKRRGANGVAPGGGGFTMARAHIASWPLHGLCAEWLDSQIAPSVTLEAWLVEDMIRRCGQEAVDAWQAAVKEAGRPVDPYPFLEPAEGQGEG